MARSPIKSNSLEIIQLGALGAAVILAIVAAYGNRTIQTLFAVVVFSVTFAVLVGVYFYHRFARPAKGGLPPAVKAAEFDTRRISRAELAEKFKLNTPISLEPLPDMSDLDANLSDLNNADTQFRLKMSPAKQPLI